MRFMMLMIPNGYENAEPNFTPNTDAVMAMLHYNQEMQEAGVLLSLDGLRPPATGARVSFAGGRPLVAHGPFPETRETVGGYWLIDVASRDEAIAWAKRCPASDNEVIEVRAIYATEDLPAGVQEVTKTLARGETR